MTEKDFLKELKLADEGKIFEDIKSRNLPVVIFGAAACAKKVTEIFTAHDIKISGYAVDSEFFKPNQNYLGLPVYNYDELKSHHDEYIFVLGIGSKSDKDGKRVKELLQEKNFVNYEWALGYCCNIKYDYIAENAGEFFTTYNLLSDNFSKKTMLDYLKAHITRNFSYLREDIFQPCEYFNEIIRGKIMGGGVLNYIDCGAFDGDTIEKFVEFVDGNYGKIFAVEPNPKMFAEIKKMIKDKGYKNISLFNGGVWNKKDSLTFFALSNEVAGSHISAKGNVIIQVDSIDNIVDNTKINLIKMDVEGSDLHALQGALKTLERDRPVLALSVYHRAEDLITIPQFVKSIYKNCRFYLRKHEGIDLYSLDLYVIPE